MATDKNTHRDHLDGERILQQIMALEDRVAELDAQTDRLQRLASLGAFAGALAHEFNNLLTPVASYAKLALASPSDVKLTQRALETALAGAEQAGRIAETLLGSLSSDEEPIADVPHVIDQCMTLIARSPAKDGVKVTINAESNILAAIPPGALLQVLLNLVLNSLRALRSHGGGTLRITAQCSTGNTNEHPVPAVQIVIHDNGPGIPEDVQQALFRPFRTFNTPANPGTPQQSGNVGLGLAICKRLLERSGGNIALESAPKQGTTFTVSLPAADANDGKRAA